MADYIKASDLALLTEGYELTMADGFMGAGMKDTVAYFDLFFRRVPDNGGFAIAAGLSKVIDYLEHLHFREEDIKYLKSKGISDELASYLKDFKFTCDVWAIPEGTPIFPNEPIIKVRGPIIEAQLIETMLLLSINQQSLIATKANRLVRAAHGTAVAEFGTRRAQGVDEAVYGARAAYIGGCVATSGVIPEKEFGIPSVNTMIHSWVQLFDSEYDAFCEYARRHPDDCTLVVDTYDTIRSGIPNAIKAFDDVLAPLGKRPKSVRIDSGDITYLSKRVRKMLDVAGYPDCDIMASNSLDEHLISDMVSQGAKVDCFIVGERLITSASSPLFGGVYKLAAAKDKDDAEFIPKIKLSENSEKVTNPGNKTIYRIYDKETGKIRADLICLADETFDESKDMIIFDPIETWKKTKIKGGTYTLRELLVPIFQKGACVYTSPSVMEIRDICTREKDTLWEESKRLVNPHEVYVDLSDKLYHIKSDLLEEMSMKALGEQ